MLKPSIQNAASPASGWMILADIAAREKQAMATIPPLAFRFVRAA
jgi:hypothetical protein